jgi:hypothetical protein
MGGTTPEIAQRRNVPEGDKVNSRGNAHGNEAVNLVTL